MINKHNVIYEEDLIACKRKGLCLLLRFRNCTGNIIDLSDRLVEVSQEELALAQMALSIDDKFKNQRKRTIKQAVEMVLR